MRGAGLAIVAVAALACRDSKAPPASGSAATGSGSSSKPTAAADPAKLHQQLIARAKALELPTKYEPPPGDPLSYHAAGFAKTMCSAVFISGIDLDFAAEHLGYFSAPYAPRKQLGKPIVDTVAKRVTVKLPNGVVRTAVYTGGQGCVVLPEGSDALSFTPAAIKSALPPAETQAWPMGDKLEATFPAELDKAKVQAVVDAAFEDPQTETSAFVLTWRGQLIGERYAKGITPTTPLESFSMGKSVIGTLIGVLVQQGVYTLDQPAPVPEWQAAGDPRAKIRISDLMHMSSGLRCHAPEDPEVADADGRLTPWDLQGTMPVYPGETAATYPDHVYFYTGAIDAFKWAATRPLQWPPNTVGRYRNGDPLLLAYLTRLAVEKRGEDYLGFPQRALFDKIGVRTMVLETDPFGNFLTSGYELMSARDWARLGNLYLRDGVTPGGERLLPQGFAKFVSTVAPAWAGDGRPVYGAMFWTGNNAKILPKDTYMMRGAGGQITWVIPSLDVVMVRLGFYKGDAAQAKSASMPHLLKSLVAAVPRR